MTEDTASERHVPSPREAGRVPSECEAGEGLVSAVRWPPPGSALRASPPSPRFTGRGKEERAARERKPGTVARRLLRVSRRSWTFGRAGVDNDSRAIFSTGGRASPDAGRADWGRTWGA
jgi:hypothetical protein